MKRAVCRVAGVQAGLALAVCGAVAALRPAQAQTPPAGPAGRIATLADSPRSVLVWPATGVPSGDFHRLTGRPRSFQVVVVPVPAPLPRDSAVEFEVLPSGGASILGALRGALPPGRTDARKVILTVSVPANALAGRHTIATVRFGVAGAPRIQVPIELEVTQVWGSSVEFTQQLFAAWRGGQVRIPYSLVNTGNGPDSLAVELQAPRGWRATAEPARLVVGPRQSVQGVVTLSVPRSSPTGASRLRFSVTGRGGERARSEAAIEVVEGQFRSPRSGPQLTTGMAGVLGDTGATTPVVGLELNGAVGDHVSVNGRLVQVAGPGQPDARGLARVGYFVGTPYLTLASDVWQFTAGTTGRSFSDVTGVDLWGRGGSFAWEGTRWTVATLAAWPTALGTGSDDGRLLGARVGMRLGQQGGWLGATATDLEDRQVGDRRLAAFGFGAVSPAVRDATLSAEVVNRWHGTGQGLGWMAELARRRADESLKIRYAHAPGGSAAFARARDQFSAAAGRKLHRSLWLGSGYWLADDGNAVFSRLRSSGWSLTPQLGLSERTTLELEARHNAYDASGSTGAFGSAETVARLAITSRLGSLHASGSADLGRVARSTTPPGGSRTEDAAGRQAVRALFGWATERGVLEANANFEHTGAGVGLLPRQYIVGLRVDRVAVLPGRAGPVLSAGLQHFGWFGDQPDVTVVRAGVQVPVPGELVLTLDAERNPFVRGPGNSIPWIVAVKLERTFGVPLGRFRASARGVVYQDLNGNGAREPEEAGVSGVLVRRAGESAVTDHEGRFRFFVRSDAPPHLDETSLPFGVVASPGATDRPTAAGQFEIGVIPTAAVEVQLVPTAGEDGRLPRVDLATVVVRARDERGSAWTARADGAGVATFSALPPGQYRLELDLGGLSEPLRPRGELPGFTVTPGRTVPRLTIPVYPRPIRLRDGGSPGGGRQRSQLHQP